MASLNTLRTKGGVIVSIVIGIALLAFVLTLDESFINFFTGNGPRDPKIGEIADNKIKYSEFVNERTKLENVTKLMTGRSSFSTEESDMTSNMTWESFVMNLSYKPGFEKLGISVSDAEQIDMTTGVYLSPVITSMFVNQQTGMYDPVYLREFIDNMEREPRPETLSIWNYIKDQMTNQRVMEKYMQLVGKGVFVTDLEVDRALAASNKISDIRVVSQPLSSIADSLVNVSSGEIREYYNNHKNRFRQNASRDIDYVLFEITPTQADFDNAEKRFNDLFQNFVSAENPVQYASLNSPEDRTPARYVRESQLDSDIAQTVLNGEVYGPVLKSETYVAARLADSRLMPDTVNVDHILLPPTDRQLADSLLTVIRRGGNFAELAREYSLDINTSAAGGNMGDILPENIETELPEFFEAILNGSRSDVEIVEASYGIQIIRINSKTAPVRKYKVATLRSTVKASSATQNAMMVEATDFYRKANGSSTNFSKAVTESALTKRIAHIRNSDRTVSGLDGSLELIRWAFSNKVNTVSEPIPVGLDYFVVATVTDAREDGIGTLEQSTAAIRATLLSRKKADMIAARMQGSSLDAIASAVDAEPVELEGVRFTDFYLQGVGVEPRLVGAVAAANSTGTVSSPVKGASGVYVFQVDDIRTDENTNLVDEKVRLEAAGSSYINERTAQALYEESNIKDQRVRYF